MKTIQQGDLFWHPSWGILYADWVSWSISGCYVYSIIGQLGAVSFRPNEIELISNDIALPA